MYFPLLLAVLETAIGARAAPTGDNSPPSVPALAERSNTTSFELGKRCTTLTQGHHNGYFYSWWPEGDLEATYTNLEDGKYSIQWEAGNGNFVGGKGWTLGGERTVEYSGEFNPIGNGYLALYGWTINPLVEYYILENFGTYNPAEHAQKKGQVQSDGSTYDIYLYIPTNQPSLDNVNPIPRYWSIRTQKRTVGVITTSNHFRAWEQVGMKMGTHDFMIVATAGNSSHGSATISVDSPP